MNEPPEHEERLWWLAISPGIWIIHLLASYATVAVWCAKAAPESGSLGPTRIAVAIYTALALVGIALVGRNALKRHRYGTATAPHDFDTCEDRHRFLGFATLLLAIISFIAVGFVALPLVFFDTCR